MTTALDVRRTCCPPWRCVALRCVALRWDVDGDLRLSGRTRADVVITIVACPPRIARTSCVSPELSVGRRSPPVAYPGSTCLLPDRGWGYETWHEVVGYVVEEVDVEARRDGLHRHSVRHARLRGRLCDPSFWAWRLTSSNCPLPALSACSHPGSGGTARSCGVRTGYDALSGATLSRSPDR